MKGFCRAFFSVLLIYKFHLTSRHEQMNQFPFIIVAGRKRPRPRPEDDKLSKEYGSGQLKCSQCRRTTYEVNEVKVIIANEPFSTTYPNGVARRHNEGRRKGMKRM